MTEYKVKVQNANLQGHTHYYKTMAKTDNGKTFLMDKQGMYHPIADTAMITTIWALYPNKGYVSLDPTHDLGEAIEKLNKYLSL